MIQPLDSDTNTTMVKSKELSIDLIKHIIDLNRSEMSLGAISKKLQDFLKVGVTQSSVIIF